MSALPKPRPEIIILPPEGHHLAAQLDGVQLPPDATIFVAVTPEGKIVGRTSICPMLMVEGTHVAVEHRGTSLAMRLIKTLEDFMRQSGRTHTAAMVADDQPEVADYLKRFGYEKQPITFWSKDLRKGK